MKKILVVTFVRAFNYGASLQAYATDYILKKLNIESVFLNYKEKTHFFNNIFKDKTLKSIIFYLRENVFNFIYLSKTFVKRKRFNEFIEQNITLSREFSNPEQVLKNPPKADAYMTGSDQMFNVKNSLNPVFFLEFAEKNAERFSYATSMGNASVPDDVKERFFNDLKKYNNLSLREYQAKEYIEKEGLITHQHIDPTLLLSEKEWSTLIKNDAPIIKEPYILVYYLLTHPLIDRVLQELKAKTGYKIVCIPKNNFAKINADITLRDVGPLEFLNLFKHASQVVTTSFHGTCFSVIFKRDFYSLTAKEEKRTTSLAKLLNFEKRVVKDKFIFDDSSVDWNYCDDIISKERRRSLDYLTCCVKGEKY